MFSRNGQVFSRIGKCLASVQPVFSRDMLVEFRCELKTPYYRAFLVGIEILRTIGRISECSVRSCVFDCDFLIYINKEQEDNHTRIPLYHEVRKASEICIGRRTVGQRGERTWTQHRLRWCKEVNFCGFGAARRGIVESSSVGKLARTIVLEIRSLY